KIILVLATVGTYVVHVRTLNAEMERKILSGNAGEVYVKSVRAKVIHLGRIIVILSVAILLLAALLDSGGL
ncbi:MAG TPA: copper-binding protein, partial [Nitrososphaera sp.]